MPDVLSQDEIDNLLKALSSGELDVEEMRALMKNRSRIMTLQDHLSSPRNI